MALRSPLLLLLATAGFATSIVAGKGYYRAAVVDYEVLKNSTLTSHQNLMVNVRNYEQFLKKAQKQQADIIVFPEEGLFGGNYSLFLTIPDPALTLIPNASYDESIRTLSGYARTYKMYLAVNVHENYTDPSSHKSYKYNTNIVFDRSGALIARYRKYNLYGEPLDHPAKPEYSYFKSDFNVTFGQFICFDLLFKEPALTLINKYNVFNFIYPSQWYSELPFLTSVQTQWSWAVGNNVNLLSAGRAGIAKGNTGSGIFRGNNALNNLYSFSDHLGSTMLIADVSTIRNKTTDGSGKGDSRIEIYHGTERLPLMQQPKMDQFANENITLPSNQTSGNFTRKICHEKLCCNFDLTVQYVNPTSSVQYKAVVFDGKRMFGATGKHEFGLQLCGVVLCSNGSISSCGAPAVSGVLPHDDTSIPKVIFTAINITGNFIYDNANPLPNVLLWPSGALPNTPGSLLINTKQVNFDSNATMSSLTVNTQNQIMTVAIHSRVFSRDTGNSANMMNVSMLTMIISMLPLLTRYL